MEQSNKTVSDLFGVLKSWIPRRPEPANVSRDFWMPDHSCTVCYECDVDFTVFNRRHHCRLCGRIFCAKCTTNSVPAPCNDYKQAGEEWERVRVCNYCFKQWEIATSDKVVNDGGSIPSSSTSGGSFASSGSSRTAYCSTVTLGSRSLGHCEQMSCSTPLSPCESGETDPYQSAEMNLFMAGQGEDGSGCSNNSGAFMGDQSPNQFGMDSNRFEYEDDGYSYQLDSKAWADDYYEQDDVSEDGCGSSNSLQPDGEKPDRKSFSSSLLRNGYDTHDSFSIQDVKQEIDHDDCEEAPSSLCAAEDIDMEPVDLENNQFLWLPPEPENEEDENDAILLGGDDEGHGMGGFGCLPASSSFGSGDWSCRESFSEDHKKGMKSIVDGHFRALVSQLLQVENISVDENYGQENWMEIITSLCWEAATILKPDMSRGGGMDPAGYVKVKCIASGRRSQSAVVKGVVCKKNVAHRRMKTRAENPRLMILGGALEYQRVSNHLSSVDTLLKQEMDHLKMAVAKIDAHHPDVLLVEKSVSRVAQDYILEKDIILVLKIKRPLLERIARCTGAQIVPSVDHVSAQNIGYCGSFHVERVLEEHGSAGHGGKKLSKTLMFIEGCPRPLGCTILLKGAKGDDLKKVKAVIQYAVFAAYHLALETSFLADEGASLPELPPNEPIRVAIPSKSPSVDTSISKFQAFAVSPTIDGSKASECLPVDFNVSYSSSRPLEGYRSSFSLQKGIQSAYASRENKFPGDTSMQSKSTDYNGDFIAIDKYNTKQFCRPSRGNEGEPLFENATNVKDAKYCQDEPGSSKEEFPSPSDNQSILVTSSSRCVLKGTVCEEVHLVRIKYYGSSDKPLGRVLQDHLFDQSYRCRSCEMPSDAHVQCYTHRQGTLTISVKKLPNVFLPGELDGKIWMWHRCTRCPRSGGIPPATRRVIMSDAAWGLSFGKFLELSFSNHAAASRVASCGHSLHRDCLRFYGCGTTLACFRYASTDLHSVILPSLKVIFNYEIQEWIKKEADEVVGRAEVLFNEVLSALTHIVEKSSAGGSLNSGADAPESRVHIAELKEVLQNEKVEFEEILRKTLKREVKEGQPIVDILEINRLRRQLLFQSYMWDHRLVYASSLDKNTFPTLLDCSSVDKALEAQEISATDLLSPGKFFKSLNPILVNSKSTSQSPKKAPELYSSLNQVQENGAEAMHLTDVLVDNFDHFKTPEPTDKSDSGIRRALSDGHFSLVTNLSDTLDAAWTGKSQPVVATSKDSSFQLCASVSVDSSLAAVVERLAMESQVENQAGEVKVVPTAPSPCFSTISKNSDLVEETMSWFSMPFLNFYRSLNKNFLGDSQKLDTVGGYTPVYVSSYRELELRSGARLLLPVGVNETVIPVFDDEPTSIIAYALVSEDYHGQLNDEGYRPKEMLESSLSLPLHDSMMFNSFQSGDDAVFKNPGPLDEKSVSVSGSQSSLVSDSVVYPKSLHFRVAFSDNGPLDKVKYSVTCYHAKQFDALRKICCPSEIDFVRSLSRCKKWGAQGGKSNVFFAKTLDERFIIKQVTKTELESFIKFAPEYFKYLTEAISMGSPTCLAKILGIYQIVTKSFKGGREIKMDVLVMENLLFGKKVTRLYDLKGSSRSRYNPDTNGSNKVLLDQNLLEMMPTSPIFVGKKAKRTLERAVWNDTSFLATVDVMDYSLLAGVDEEKHEIFLGIIDFMRQYTWDKHLETWVKASGILGGSKNSSPTVISPMQYKKRFRKAMGIYFLVVPDQWLPLGANSTTSQGDDTCEEDNSQSEESTDKCRFSVESG